MSSSFPFLFQSFKILYTGRHPQVAYLPCNLFALVSAIHSPVSPLPFCSLTVVPGSLGSMLSSLQVYPKFNFSRVRCHRTRRTSFCAERRTSTPSHCAANTPLVFLCSSWQLCTAQWRTNQACITASSAFRHTWKQSALSVDTCCKLILQNLIIFTECIRLDSSKTV